MNYSQTLTWLFERLPMYQRVGPPAMRLGLDQMNRLSAALGDLIAALNLYWNQWKGINSSYVGFCPANCWLYSWTLYFSSPKGFLESA